MSFRLGPFFLLLAAFVASSVAFPATYKKESVDQLKDIVELQLHNEEDLKFEQGINKRDVAMQQDVALDTTALDAALDTTALDAALENTALENTALENTALEATLVRRTKRGTKKVRPKRHKGIFYKWTDYGKGIKG